MAQTFTPGVSGALTDVVLRLEGTAQTVNVALTPVDGTGRPVATSPLASASVTGALQRSPAVDVAVAFPAPATVERGRMYALVVNAPDEDAPNGVYVDWAADFGFFFLDDNGVSCTIGGYAGGRARGRTESGRARGVQRRLLSPELMHTAGPAPSSASVAADVVLCEEASG